uniref:EGF-like domain-containing protein n=1 Tax=Strongyloides papillosus TaxID=174720 RepID=A0A0N5CB13_STREA
MKYTSFFTSIILVLLLINFNNAWSDFEDFEDLRLIKEFAKTWNFTRKVTYRSNLLEDKPKKYDTIAYVNDGSSCQQPGYTGKYCEFPICETSNHEHFDRDNIGVLVDFIQQPSCNKSAPLFVDVSMFSFTIEVHGPGSNQPDISVYNKDSKLISPFSTDTTDPTKKIYVYSPQIPGVYQMVPSTKTPELGCFLYVAALANSHIDVGFVPSSHYDSVSSERNDFPNRNPYLHQLNTIVAHTTNVRKPGAITALSIFERYNIMSRPHKFSIRYGCEFDYYYNSLFCLNEDYYFMKVEGYDFFGNSFSRIKSFACLVNPNPPTSPPSTTQKPMNPTQCFNNGTLVKNKDGTSYCYCKNLFTSYDCSKRICLNNGQPLDDGSCLCTEGFTGDHCQDVQCSAEPGVVPPQHQHKPIFVIRLRKKMTGVIYQLADKIKQLAKDLVNFQDHWFQNFGVITFNNGGKFYDYHSFTSVEDFTKYLTDISNNNDTSGGCNDVVFSAITTAINVFEPGSHSPIYVLTDAIPNDSEFFDDLSLLNSYYQSPIYTFFFGDLSCYGSGINSKEWKLMQQLSERFSGNVFKVYDHEIDEFGDIFYHQMSNTYFKSELMYGNDLDICSSLDHYNSLAVDTEFDTLSVIATGSNLDLQLTAPDGNSIPVTPVIQTTSITIWRYNGLQSGQWQFHIIPKSVTTSCSIRVYSVVTIQGDAFAPFYKLYWAFTNQVNLDANFYQPLVGQSSSFVARLENYKLTDPTKVNAEIVVYSKTDSNRTMLSASNGLWRDGCKFQMYFSPLHCYNSGETLYFTLFVSDPNGFNIQRAGSVFCSDFSPTELPPGSCQNGGFLLNGTCVCRPQYTGRFCETPICQNGGTVVGGKCTCPPLVSGTFCEFIMCPDEPITPEPLKKKQTLTFLLDITYTNRYFLKQLATYSDVMIRDIISHDSDIIDYIYVVGFDDSETPMVIGMTDGDNLGYVREYFTDAYLRSMKARQDCVNAKVWQALNLARMLNEPHGKVFLFQSSLPDEDTQVALEFYTNVYDKIIEKRLTLSAYIGANGQGVYNCPGSKYSFLLIETLAKATYQGDYLEISYPSYMNVPKVVPSFVNSGIAYKKTFNDCMGNCSIYFSVDSHTQNIQAVVKGSTGGFDVSFIMPNQSVDPSSYGLIEDSTTGYWVMETRKECEDGWERLGEQYCFRLTSRVATWYEAYNDCLQNNAFLVDDLYPAKDSYLTSYLLDYNISSIWLGLTDDPQYSEGGAWTWNHGPLGDIPLSSTHFKNWSPTANLNDPNKQCAYKTRTWDTDNCSNRRSYICQKHTYRDNFIPSISESEKLPPGKWRIIITSKGITTIEVRVQSKIRVVSGFLSNIHGDAIDFNANMLSTTQRMATHVSGYGNNIFDTYMVNSRMFLLNNTMFEAVNYQLRLSCTYQYLSQIFSCPKNDLASTDFYALTTGVDELGYTIQRYTAHRCVQEIKKCNHGVAYQDQCICDDSWTGTLCDIPICQNNGTYNNLTKTCTCTTGYSGETCDKPMCFDRSPIKISRNEKMLALVIENTQENLIALNSLKKNISDTLRGLNPKWFDQYTYVLFDSSNKIVLQNFNDLSHFITSIQTIVPQDDTTSCNLPVFNAITTAFNQLNHQQSVVYTITRALPSDLYNRHEFEETLVQKGPQFYYHTISGDSGCTTDMSNNITSLLQQYTIGSGGNFFTTTGQEIGSAFSVIIPSLYHGSVLSDPTLLNNSCSQGLTAYAFVSRNMTDMYFYIYGQYATVSVKSPTNETLQPRTVFSGQPTGTSPRLFIYQIPVLTDYGIYTATITSSGNCYAQIRNTGGPEIYYGFVPSSPNKLDIGNHLDNATVAPMSDYNHFVGSVVGDIAAIEYVEIYNAYSKEYQYLKFYGRNNCTYHYYSDPFKCERGLLYLAIYARDDSGFVITRAGITQCTQYIVTPTYQPPTTTTTTTTTTTPGGIITTTTTSPATFTAKANIYLITDVSASVSAEKYANTLTNFLMQIFNKFKIDPNYVNVAFSPSPGDDDIWFTLPVFNAFFSSETLRNSINSSYYPIMGKQSSGQKQLSEVIGMALDSRFLATGYNPSYKPHWLIYVTTTSSPDSDAIKAAQKVRESRTFKVVTIAYQPVNNVQPLSMMSDCFYPILQQEQLSAIATALVAKINFDSSKNQDGPC